MDSVESFTEDMKNTSEDARFKRLAKEAGISEYFLESTDVLIDLKIMTDFLNPSSTKMSDKELKELIKESAEIEKDSIKIKIERDGTKEIASYRKIDERTMERSGIIKQVEFNGDSKIVEHYSKNMFVDYGIQNHIVKEKSTEVKNYTEGKVAVNNTSFEELENYNYERQPDSFWDNIKMDGDATLFDYKESMPKQEKEQQESQKTSIIGKILGLRKMDTRNYKTVKKLAKEIGVDEFFIEDQDCMKNFSRYLASINENMSYNDVKALAKENVEIDQDGVKFGKEKDTYMEIFEYKRVGEEGIEKTEVGWMNLQNRQILEKCDKRYYKKNYYNYVYELHCSVDKRKHTAVATKEDMDSIRNNMSFNELESYATLPDSYWEEVFGDDEEKIKQFIEKHTAKQDVEKSQEPSIDDMDATIQDLQSKQNSQPEKASEVGENTKKADSQEPSIMDGVESFVREKIQGSRPEQEMEKQESQETGIIDDMYSAMQNLQSQYRKEIEDDNQQYRKQIEEGYIPFLKELLIVYDYRDIIMEELKAAYSRIKESVNEFINPKSLDTAQVKKQEEDEYERGVRK